MTLHGRGSNAQQQLLLTGFAQLAEEGRFLVVAPDARGGRWDVTGQRDVAYLDRVLDAVPCVDPARIYASGMSMGSAMTFALACQPQRTFAAFGGVALAAYRPVCAAAPPAPLIYFHGTADPIVPFRGGTPQGESVTLPPVPAAMREWAAHNACTADTAERTKDVTLREWTGCEAGAGWLEFVVPVSDPIDGFANQDHDLRRTARSALDRRLLPERPGEVLQRGGQLGRHDPHLVGLALGDLRQRLQVLVGQQFGVGVGGVDRVEHLLHR
jgi:pimeloyl-ACP methyl ester carboxylesterase